MKAIKSCLALRPRNISNFSLVDDYSLINGTSKSRDNSLLSLKTTKFNNWIPFYRGILGRWSEHSEIVSLFSVWEIESNSSEITIIALEQSFVYRSEMAQNKLLCHNYFQILYI